MFILSAAALLFLAGCGANDAETPTDNPIEEMTLMTTAHVASSVTPAATELPEGVQNLWTDEELYAMAKTLSGECYDDKELDKRRVCEVILNRVSDGRFGASICEVITAENQFHGYWNPSRPVSESDLSIAEQTLKDWFANDCKPFSAYLFFCAGENRENTFYEDIEW